MLKYDHNKAHFKNENGKESVKLSFGIEAFHSMLLAKKHKVLHDKIISKSEWKNLVLKLIEKLEITIINSIKTDPYHLEQIKAILDDIKNSCEVDFYKYQPDIIAELIRLSFTLIGNVPDMEGLSKHKEQYFATDYRSINYSQNIHQKVRMILLYSHSISKSEEFYKKRSELSSNDHKFLNWIKEKHQDIYCKLF